MEAGVPVGAETVVEVWSRSKRQGQQRLKRKKGGEERRGQKAVGCREMVRESWRRTMNEFIIMRYRGEETGV